MIRSTTNVICMEQTQSGELLGATVDRARQDADISIRQLGVEAGIPFVTLRRKLLGHGTSTFTVLELRAIARALGRPTVDLIPAELLA